MLIVEAMLPGIVRARWRTDKPYRKSASACGPTLVIRPKVGASANLGQMTGMNGNQDCSQSMNHSFNVR